LLLTEIYKFTRGSSNYTVQNRQDKWL